MTIDEQIEQLREDTRNCLVLSQEGKDYLKNAEWWIKEGFATYDSCCDTDSSNGPIEAGILEISMKRAMDRIAQGKLMLPANALIFLSQQPLIDLRNVIHPEHGVCPVIGDDEDDLTLVINGPSPWEAPKLPSLKDLLGE